MGCGGLGPGVAETTPHSFRLLGRTGTLWSPHESCDHCGRNEQGCQRLVGYIEFDAVAVGLATAIEPWPGPARTEVGRLTVNAQGEACATGTLR